MLEIGHGEDARDSTGVVSKQNTAEGDEGTDADGRPGLASLLSGLDDSKFRHVGRLI